MTMVMSLFVSAFQISIFDEFKKKGVFLDIYILVKTVLNVFARKDIYEAKVNEEISDEEAAKIAEMEIIRKAHEPEI